jgi:hypothetical protein
MPDAPAGTKSKQVVACVLCAAALWARQAEAVTATASEALALCDAADAAPMSDRIELLSRGLERAEEAVRANPRDAAAHFAVFCNLGKRAELRRNTLGFFGILGDLGRIRREIDDTLVLAPDYPAALAAKGEMLTELPRFLGGNPEEGQRLLERAAALDPDDSRIRSMLADGAGAGAP